MYETRTYLSTEDGVESSWVITTTSEGTYVEIRDDDELTAEYAISDHAVQDEMEQAAMSGFTRTY